MIEDQAGKIIKKETSENLFNRYKDCDEFYLTEDEAYDYKILTHKGLPERKRDTLSKYDEKKKYRFTIETTDIDATPFYYYYKQKYEDITFKEEIMTKTNDKNGSRINVECEVAKDYTDLITKLENGSLEKELSTYCNVTITPIN